MNINNATMFTDEIWKKLFQGYKDREADDRFIEFMWNLFLFLGGVAFTFILLLALHILNPL